MWRCRLGGARRADAERRDAQQPLEPRIAVERRRIDTPGREERAEVEEPLRFRGAEKEIAVDKRVEKRGVVVREDPLVLVVEVLDDERVVEIDHGREVARVGEELVGDVALNDRHVGSLTDVAELLRRDRSGEKRHVVPVRVHDFRHLEEADADSGRLALAERLGADQHHAAHRPFTFSTIECSFHVREA